MEYHAKWKVTIEKKNMLSFTITEVQINRQTCLSHKKFSDLNKDRKIWS